MGLITTLVIAAGLGLITGAIARSKGYGFAEWWCFGAALFIVALPVVLVKGPNPETRRPCPLCRTVIDRAAAVCPQCGRDLDANVPADA